MIHSREERFIRLGNKRVTKLLKDLDTLSNLSSRSNYIYNEQQVETMFRALQDKLTEVHLRFTYRNRKNIFFSFDD